MLKRLLYAIICFVVFASCLLPLASCGSKAPDMGVSAWVEGNEYDPESDYSVAVIAVAITNRNEGNAITACSVKINFLDSVSRVVDTKTETFTNINVAPGERETFYAVYAPEEGTGAVKGAFEYVDAVPNTMTLEASAGEAGSFWGIVGIVGAVIGVVFVAGVIWGVFFD